MMILVILILVEAMLNARMECAHVFQNIKAIHTLDVDLNVLAMENVLETKLVQEINVLIPVPELVEIMQFVML
jgi:hypothetical protein